MTAVEDHLQQALAALASLQKDAGAQTSGPAWSPHRLCMTEGKGETFRICELELASPFYGFKLKRTGGHLCIVRPNDHKHVWLPVKRLLAVADTLPVQDINRWDQSFVEIKEGDDTRDIFDFFSKLDIRGSIRLGVKPRAKHRTYNLLCSGAGRPFTMSSLADEINAFRKDLDDLVARCSGLKTKRAEAEAYETGWTEGERPPAAKRQRTTAA